MILLRCRPLSSTSFKFVPLSFRMMYFSQDVRGLPLGLNFPFTFRSRTCFAVVFSSRLIRNLCWIFGDRNGNKFYNFLCYPRLFRQYVHVIFIIIIYICMFLLCSYYTYCTILPNKKNKKNKNLGIILLTTIIISDSVFLTQFACDFFRNI